MDICCFNRPFDDQSQLKVKLETDAKLFIQQDILNGKYELIWSYILDFENRRNPFETKRTTIAKWKSIASRSCIETAEIILFAENLHFLGIKPLDALHISCAKSAGCDYFITTDRHLTTKTVEGIRIVNPLTFIAEGSD